jgi:hypothetical protein
MLFSNVALDESHQTQFAWYFNFVEANVVAFL